MTIFTQLLSESQSTNSTRQLFWSFQSSFKLSILFAGTVDFFLNNNSVRSCTVRAVRQENVFQFTENSKWTRGGSARQQTAGRQSLTGNTAVHSGGRYFTRRLVETKHKASRQQIYTTDSFEGYWMPNVTLPAKPIITSHQEFQWIISI